MADDHFERMDSQDYTDIHGRPYMNSERNSDYVVRQDGYRNILLCATFVLELLILTFVIVLEYFLRWTDIFPLRRQNFSCTDPEISCSKEARALMADFAFNAQVPNEAVYALSFCVPPFVVLIGEIGMYTFSSEPQKPVRLLSKHCSMPQVCRRLLRFIGVFLFGAFALMVFVDIIKVIVGRLRPDFLEVCQLNHTRCVTTGGDEMCLNTDKFDLREARTSFPSLNASLTSYSAIFIAIYIHGAMRAHTVRILRPFLSLIFIMLSLLCGLTEYVLCRSHWTDVATGFAMGLVLALYIGVAVLNHFQENLSHLRLMHIFNSYLSDNYYSLDDKYHSRFTDFPSLHIPRAHMPQRLSDSSDSKYRRRPPHNTFQRDLTHTVENFRRNSYMQGSSSHM
ncbi:phospholipid phosphatase-related protein type 5-like [Haliotis rufescens]|uniref:phospholipid phosphatase-related protein type 5-like n=1 Tax=Haliotis rufescens TaxID=6454 RepID=UPI001EAFD81F|nr:phospholipid phosphatase-related protein type 5-like [Haliotis rufescens]XP_046331541.1 phospholipid phosphatase-related protein type 5-like [Haliotis rufescens]XP_046331542.1 phospholipid phosphatase-related protein type 5-like [Haliotis rufescens]XP_048255902.1 phospholipid phosphatase-related protein type 5-like [Haliotis rufescens]